MYVCMYTAAAPRERGDPLILYTTVYVPTYRHTLHTQTLYIHIHSTYTYTTAYVPTYTSTLHTHILLYMCLHTHTTIYIYYSMFIYIYYYIYAYIHTHIVNI